MPIEFPEEASGLGAWRTFVLAAGLADAVSRTVTAPVDRLKTQLQVRSTSLPPRHDTLKPLQIL